MFSILILPLLLWEVDKSHLKELALSTDTGDFKSRQFNVHMKF